MKHTPPRFGFVLPGFVSAAVLFLAVSAAQAQMAPGTNSTGTLTGPVVGTAQPSTHRPPQPPALPGARTTDNDPAPADRPTADMRPNDALFDSINRGDITSARDAIARGAELNTQNVLGLTPLELSVDLGRNDITFLLLSLRGAAPAGLPAPAKEAGKAGSPAHVAARTPVARPVPVAASRPAPAAAPRQYADTPGTPVPAAGFLGFGGATR